MSSDIPPWQVELWDAINRYVVACGGNPAQHAYGNTSRQVAVACVERAVEAACSDACEQMTTKARMPP